MSTLKKILADGRWSGLNGIGRFSKEVLARLEQTDFLTKGPSPLSLKNLIWQPYFLHQQKKHYQIYFTPGFNPVLCTSMPYVLTICDLIHLQYPGAFSILKKIFYEKMLKPSAKKAQKIITISDYSRHSIIEWAQVPEENVINVGCGVSPAFTFDGPIHQPGHAYFLHVGNTKIHKNIPRLLQAFAMARINPQTKLIFTSHLNQKQLAIVKKYQLAPRIDYAIGLNETELATYYRGAIALLFPSLYEGFGLPIIEAFASGAPVITSASTSMPEVAGPAAILVDPHQTEALSMAIENIFENETLRAGLKKKGFAQAQLFSWEKTAAKVGEVLRTC